VKTKETNKASKRIFVCSILACLTPFLLVFAYWFVLAYTNISNGVERERDIGIQHDITEFEMFSQSIMTGLEKSFWWGFGGLIAGSAIGATLQRSKKTVSSKTNESL
jgi:hypothetical protein